ncbi:MAG: MFS transporter [Lachnospiraceae bacterium]|nr:MFS transporter [Lachnospiraceae bacterium]
MGQNEEKSMIARASGLKTPEYVCYALGDAGGCLVFGLVTSILQTYYTDVLILSPFFIMVMFVLTRVWDAVNDPIMGRICDTARVSKHGRYRVWFIRVAIPLAVASVLLFCKFKGFGTPGDNLPAYIYATVTYVVWGMIYTMLQIPYGSLATVITQDVKERSKLSVFRAVGSALGSMPVMVLSMLCFATDKATGKSIVKYDVLLTGVIVMAVLSMVALFFAFIGTKERVKTEPKKHEKGAAKKALALIFKNKAMLSISVVAMLLLAGQMFTQSYYVYLIRYYFGKGGIFVSLPTILTYIPMAILMLFTPKLARRFGKKEITSVGMVVAAAANLLMFFLKFLEPSAAIMPFMALCLISGFGLNFFVLQLWAMAGDAIDEIEVSTGSRDNGTAYAFLNFFRKLGQVISAIAVNAALLAMGYYDTASTLDFTFKASQLDLMYVLATLIPAAMFGLMALFLFVWYPLSKEKVAELQNAKEEFLQAEAK